MEMIEKQGEVLKGTLMQIWKSSNIPAFIWKKYVEDFTFEDLLLFEICAREICEKFEICEIYLKLTYFLRNLQISRENNWRILRSENAKFSGYCFYMNTNIQGDFQICISVPLIASHEQIPPNFELPLVFFYSHG